jgi:hypothetical protein
MTSKKTADTPVSAIQTEDGHAVVGGRIGVGTMFRNTNVSGQPRPGAVAPVAAPSAPALPNAHVARQLAGHEVQRLRAQCDGIERSLARGFLGANGMQVPHLIEGQARDREALAEIRGEIDRLENLTDLEARQFAADKGYS